jgi:hypothetical protein
MTLSHYLHLAWRILEVWLICGSFLFVFVALVGKQTERWTDE